MNALRGIASFVITVVVLSAVAASAIMAADNALKVGVVDFARVTRDAPRVKQYREEFDQLAATLEKQLEIRSQNLMLDEAEVKELIELKLKPAEALSEKEKARINELQNKERSLDEEFKQLQATSQPTEQQKARLQELQEIQRKSKTTGEALEKDYNSRLQAKAVELEEKMTLDIQDAVKKVAEAKGLSLVLSKAAVLFGGLDITDEVINKLDRKAQ